MITDLISSTDDFNSTLILFHEDPIFVPGFVRSWPTCISVSCSTHSVNIDSNSPTLNTLYIQIFTNYILYTSINTDFPTPGVFPVMSFLTRLYPDNSIEIAVTWVTMVTVKPCFA